MQVKNPTTIYGKQVKRGKHALVRFACPHCGVEHSLMEGLRVPPCGSHQAEYIVKPEESEK